MDIRITLSEHSKPCRTTLYRAVATTTKYTTVGKGDWSPTEAEAYKSLATVCYTFLCVERARE